MSEPGGHKAPTPRFDLAPGLLAYYSSQAELMLAQYENINRLLGPTDDWTHPGDFCEILFRDFLRQFLPPHLSADKGFFYGRATLDGADTHCPEIDILVHDTQQYRPLFRMGDFVVALPQAVRAMIQVKRTFTRGQVLKGLGNVVRAKQHLLNVLWKDNPRGWNGDALPPRIFTGVLGFQDEGELSLGFYRKHLLAWNVRQRAYDREGRERTSMYVLPSFVGSLTGTFLMLDGGCNYWNQRYLRWDSRHGGANFCVQALLWKIYQVLGGQPGDMPPFAFPEDLKPSGDFHVLRITKAVGNADGSITLFRNDRWQGRYQRAGEEPAGTPPHLVRDGRGAIKVLNEPLRTDIAPQTLILRTGPRAERNVLTK